MKITSTSTVNAKNCWRKPKRLQIRITHIRSHYCKTIPGIKKLSAVIIFAELGGDIEMFATAANLTGWCGLRPKNDESAGKIKSRAIGKGNKYLRRILVQAAWAASRTKGCYLKKSLSN